MENEDTEFYLGKKEESVREEEEPSGEEFRTTYGGDIPFALIKSDDRWGSSDNMERVRLLSEKCERRSRVVSRLIYLERRQMEIITAMTGIGKKYKENGNTFFLIRVFTLFAVSCPLLVFMTWLSFKEHPGILLVVIIFLIAVLIYVKKNSNRAADMKQEELSYKFREIEEEHDLLEKEKEELTNEINRLREQQMSKLEEEQ